MQGAMHHVCAARACADCMGMWCCACAPDMGFFFASLGARGDVAFFFRCFMFIFVLGTRWGRQSDGKYEELIRQRISCNMLLSFFTVYFLV